MARQPRPARTARFAPLAALAALALALPIPFAGPAAAATPAPSPVAPTIPGPKPAGNTQGTISAATDTALAHDLPKSLLTADDLPAGFSSQDGVVEGANFNLDDAAIKKHKPARIVSQVWTGDLVGGSGPVMVFDFRLLFDSPEQAAAYLKDAEDTISEKTGSGLTKVKNAPEVGDNHRLYRGTSEQSGLKLEFENHLFTVGPVAAKVFVSSMNAADPAADAQGIAEAAAARMSAVATGTDPSFAPTPEPTVAPSQPTGSATPGPDVSTIFEGILLAHAANTLSGCFPVKERAFAGELAGIACPISSDENVVFRLMDSPEAMAAAFDPFAQEKAGKAGTCETKAALEPRLDGNDKVGQLSCYDAKDKTRVFMWTDDRWNILSWVVSSKPRNFKSMYKTARTSGPFVFAGSAPTPSSAPTGDFPSAAQAALLQHIPDNHRDACGAPDINLNEKAIAGIVCNIKVGDGQITVTYQQYANNDDLDGGYQANLDFMGITKGTGPCKDATWPGETTYDVGDQKEVGHVACQNFGDAVILMSWTDTRFEIQGYAEGFGVTQDDVYTWWHDQSGPV